MTKDEIEALEYFNEKAEKLAKTSFAQQVTLHGTSVSLSGDSSGKIEIRRVGENDELTDAFVLTLRFFIQNNEKCSIGSIAKIYELLPVEDQLRKRFESARRVLNEALESESPVKIESDSLTYQEIMEVFIYGESAHGSKRKIFDSWMRNPFAPLILKNQRDRVFGVMLRTIDYLAGINRELLTRPRSSDAQP